jgi:hypothetical protein
MLQDEKLPKDCRSEDAGDGSDVRIEGRDVGLRDRFTERRECGVYDAMGGRGAQDVSKMAESRPMTVLWLRN